MHTLTHSLPAKRWRTKSNYLMDDKQEVFFYSSARAQRMYSSLVLFVCPLAFYLTVILTFMLSCECIAISPKESSKREKKKPITQHTRRSQKTSTKYLTVNRIRWRFFSPSIHNNGTHISFGTFCSYLFVFLLKPIDSMFYYNNYNAMRERCRSE